MVDSLNAVAAYNKAQNMISSSNASPSSTDAFSNMVRNSLNESMDSIRAGEAAGIGAMTGQVSLEQLTTAVINAETSLRTVVAVRDRIISAYQDIIKMPI